MACFTYMKIRAIFFQTPPTPQKILKLYMNIYESACGYITKPPAKFNWMNNSKPPGNQVRLENRMNLLSTCSWLQI
jgi:hypothetical protein